MATDNQYARLFNKSILPLTGFKDYFLDYLRGANESVMAAVFTTGAAYVNGPVPVVATGNNKVNVGAAGGPFKATTGLGGIFSFASADSRLQNINIPPAAGVVFGIGLERALIDQGVIANPRTGLIQYQTIKEDIGRVAAPTSLTSSGTGTLTFNVNSVTSATGHDHTGRKVRIWLKAKEDGGAVGPLSTDPTVAFETLTVSFAGGNNVVTTAHNFGQVVGAESLTAADYIVQLVGPTVKSQAVEDLINTSGCFFLGYITSVAAANPIVTISTSLQKVANFGLSDLSTVFYKDAHGYLKVKVQADASDSGQQQVTVADSSGTARAYFYETGALTVTAGGTNTTAATFTGAGTGYGGKGSGSGNTSTSGTSASAGSVIPGPGAGLVGIGSYSTGGGDGLQGFGQSTGTTQRNGATLYGSFAPAGASGYGIYGGAGVSARGGDGGANNGILGPYGYGGNGGDFTGGANGGYGISATPGSGNTSAIACNGDISFGGVNHPNTQVWGGNVLSQMNIPKAWGTIATDGAGGVTVSDSWGLTYPNPVTIDGNHDIILHFANAFANTNYCVIAQCLNRLGYTTEAVAANTTTTYGLSQIDTSSARVNQATVISRWKFIAFGAI